MFAIGKQLYEMYSTLSETRYLFNPNIVQENLDIYARIFDKNISSKNYQEEIDMALKRFAPISDGKDIDLQYFESGSKLFSPLDGLSRIHLPSTFTTPAIGTDPTDELLAKFDLIACTFNPLYTPNSPSIKPNELLFQYKGLCHSPFALGEQCPKNTGHFNTGDSINWNTEMSVKLRKDVNEAHSIGLSSDLAQGPVVTLVTYDHLQRHIRQCNEILKTQYASTMRHESLAKLRDIVVSQHGKDSLVALFLHIDDTEEFLNTFVPRGICSSICTGKTSSCSESSTYQGIVTIQRSGTLNIDVADADEQLPDGCELHTANLFLVIEMKQLVPYDEKFNYPTPRMVLTSLSVDQFEEELAHKTRGICPTSKKSRDGRGCKTIICPIATLRVGPYRVYSNSLIKSNQMNEFDITMSLRSSLPRYFK